MATDKIRVSGYVDDSVKAQLKVIADAELGSVSSVIERLIKTEIRSKNYLFEDVAPTKEPQFTLAEIGELLLAARTVTK